MPSGEATQECLDKVLLKDATGSTRFNTPNHISAEGKGTAYLTLKIPAVFIGESSGTEIKKYFTYQNKTYVRITSDDADLNYLLIPFVCVVSICFIVAIFIFVSSIF